MSVEHQSSPTWSPLRAIEHRNSPQAKRLSALRVGLSAAACVGAVLLLYLSL